MRQKGDAYLKNNYLKVPLKRMAVEIGRGETYVRRRMQLLGLIRPPEVIEKFIQLSRFKKGHTSHNKGLKIHEFMTPAQIRKSAKTRFKKGHKPWKTKPKGTISIRTDKRGVQYKFIKLRDGVWLPLLRYNWERVHGKLKKGYKLIHKDGNTMNCAASNGKLLTDAQLMKRNSCHRYPKEISSTIQLQGVLKRIINKKLKFLSNEKQDKRLTKSHVRPIGKAK